MDNATLKLIFDVVESIGYEVESTRADNMPGPVVLRDELITTDRMTIVVKKETKIPMPK
jgi:hypothetical protein